MWFNADISYIYIQSHLPKFEITKIYGKNDFAKVTKNLAGYTQLKIILFDLSK